MNLGSKESKKLKDQKIKTEAQAKQLNDKALQTHQSAALKQALHDILAGVKTLFETPTKCV